MTMLWAPTLLQRAVGRLAEFAHAGSPHDEIHQRRMASARFATDEALGRLQSDYAAAMARRRSAEERRASSVSGTGAALLQRHGMPVPSLGKWGLEAPFASRLERMMAEAPGRISVTSGLRSRQQQADLYRRKPHLAAPPGRSRHEDLDHEPGAEAADLAFESPAVQAWAHANAHRYGLRFPMGTRRPGKKYEPWHIEPL